MVATGPATGKEEDDDDGATDIEDDDEDDDGAIDIGDDDQKDRDSKEEKGFIFV